MINVIAVTTNTMFEGENITLTNEIFKVVPSESI